MSLIRDEFKVAMEEINQTIRQQEDRQSKKIYELEKSHEINLENMEKHYVKKAEFTPVERIVYGMVGVIMTAVLVSLLTNIKYTPQIEMQKSSISQGAQSGAK